MGRMRARFPIVRDEWLTNFHKANFKSRMDETRKFNRLTMSGSELIFLGDFYENYRFKDQDGKVYYITPENLSRALQQSNFKVKPKITRIWLEPTTEIQNI